MLMVGMCVTVSDICAQGKKEKDEPEKPLVFFAPYIANNPSGSSLGFNVWFGEELNKLTNADTPADISTTKISYVITENGKLQQTLSDDGDNTQSPILDILSAIANKRNRWVSAKRGGKPVECKIDVVVSRQNAKWNYKFNMSDEYSEKYTPINKNVAAPDSVERMPKFKNGDIRKFKDWVMSQMVYPRTVIMSDINGRLVASFVVNEDGYIEYIDVLNSPHADLTSAVMKALSKSPKWTPGTINGKYREVRFNLPIDFMFSAPRPVPITSPRPRF